MKKPPFQAVVSVIPLANIHENEVRYWLAFGVEAVDVVRLEVRALTSDQTRKEVTNNIPQIYASKNQVNDYYSYCKR